MHLFYLIFFRFCAIQKKTLFHDKLYSWIILLWFAHKRACIRVSDYQFTDSRFITKSFPALITSFGGSNLRHFQDRGAEYQATCSINDIP